MTFDKDALERLQNSRDFYLFAETLYRARESAIAEMHARPTESLQYLAGRICQADDILNQVNYLKMRDRWVETLRGT